MKTKNIAILYKKHRKQTVIGVVLVIVLVIGAWWFFYGRLSSAEKSLATAKSSVSRHLLLPTNEQPTLATVEDTSKLTNKFLASKAQNGDQILIYTENQMAIIYRPSIDRIVAVATVTADSALAESQKATLTVLDGAGDAAKTQALIAKIKSQYPDMIVTYGGVANKHDYARAVVIDNTGAKDYLVEALATLTGGSHGVVPLSETKTDTDLMVIVGTDK